MDEERFKMAKILYRYFERKERKKKEIMMRGKQRA